MKKVEIEFKWEKVNLSEKWTKTLWAMFVYMKVNKIVQVVACFLYYCWQSKRDLVVVTPSYIC